MSCAVRSELAVTRPSEPVFVEGDLTRLVQVLGNLLSNAVKYTSPGDRIELAGGRAGGPRAAAAKRRARGHCDGSAALELAAARHPDLALLDIGMPHIDGFELARRIRAQPWGSRLPLVALSGWGQSKDFGRTRESGFDWHLVKPVSFEEVAGVIDRLSARTAAAET